MIPVAALILLVGRAHFLFFAVGGLIDTWARSGTDPVSRWSRLHRFTAASPTRSRRSNEYDHPIAASRWFINGRSRSSFQDHGTRGAP